MFIRWIINIGKNEASNSRIISIGSKVPGSNLKNCRSSERIPTQGKKNIQFEYLKPQIKAIIQVPKRTHEASGNE
jgi:hypothetical protein